jgi:lipoate-protein ligase A
VGSVEPDSGSSARSRLGPRPATSLVGWEVDLVSGHPRSLLAAHERPGGPRKVVWCRPTASAIVLGSSQAIEPVGAGELPVLRRRAGGGAVLVVPGELCWIDVFLPRLDVLWEEDVGRSSLWIGETWCKALDRVGVPGAVVRDRRGRDGIEGVCFASASPGEVEVEGRKVVGVSQRRTREGSVFHTAALLSWDPVAIAAIFGLPVAPLRQAAVGLEELAGGSRRDRLEASLWTSFLDVLPTA